MSKKKSWEKRLNGVPDDRVVNFVESLSYDKRLYKYDIVGSIAHAQMLMEQKLISKKEFQDIKKGLIEISEEISSGKFKFNKSLEDIHMVIEDALTTKVGEAGEKLQTGRSRNDQVTTDLRLWMRDEIDSLQTKIMKLQKVLVKLADKHAEDIIPGYTHMQRAQPVCIGAYVLNFVERLERDFNRFEMVQKQLDASPLGSGAVAGSTLMLDRKSTAAQLGFNSLCMNSIDAVSDRDFCAEFIFDCSLIAAHLSGLAEDWIIYSSNEFGFICIDDAFCTSSSMMPQKRNPDVLELIRAKTGAVYGSLIAILAILKGLPTGYSRDLQEDKIHVFNSADIVAESLEIAAAVVSHTQFKTKKIASGLEEGFLDATALAEYLVEKGIPFRQAHGIVGSLVADCEKKNKSLGDLGKDEFKKYSKVIEKDVYKRLGAANVAASYVTEGAAGPDQTKKRIAYWQKHLAKR